METAIQDKFVLENIKIRKPPSNKNQNLLASASLTLKGDSVGYFTITGFLIWKSKFEGLNVTPPKSRTFTFVLFEGGLWKSIKQEILKKYEEEGIPIIKEDGNGGYTI